MNGNILFIFSIVYTHHNHDESSSNAYESLHHDEDQSIAGESFLIQVFFLTYKSLCCCHEGTPIPEREVIEFKNAYHL